MKLLNDFLISVWSCTAHLYAHLPFGKGLVILPFVFFSRTTVIPAAAGIIITRSTICERRGIRLFHPRPLGEGCGVCRLFVF